jgi:hypothetical protein
VIKSHDVGAIQYIEWLILIDRVQPSFIAGVCAYRRGLRSGLAVRLCARSLSPMNCWREISPAASSSVVVY